MVNIVQRTRKLRELLWIRVGPGALVLPKEVTKISMEFQNKILGGHRGAKHFWREMLPRMKYRNPAVPMTIHRHKDENGPALLHIYTSSDTSPPKPSGGKTPPSATPNAQNTLTPDTTPPTHTIDIKNKHESEILDLLIAKTGATQMKATQQELEELEEIKEFKIRSEKDRAEVLDKLTRARREEELLRLARGEVPAS